MEDFAKEAVMWVCFVLGAIMLIGAGALAIIDLYGRVLFRKLRAAYKLASLRHYMKLAERKGRMVRKGT